VALTPVGVVTCAEPRVWVDLPSPPDTFESKTESMVVKLDMGSSFW
jgi:hypothetical protein